MSKKERVISILNEVKPTRDLSEIEDIVEGGYLDSFELMFLIKIILDIRSPLILILSFAISLKFINLQTLFPYFFNS